MIAWLDGLVMVVMGRNDQSGEEALKRGIRQRDLSVCCDFLLGQQYVCCVVVYTLLNGYSTTHSEHAVPFIHSEIDAGSQIK